ncbi:MAG: RAMP superfamily CRISPR-associated protein [Candidatus Bathyarchaeia archaeon]
MVEGEGRLLMAVFCYRLRGVLRAVTSLHIGSGARTGVIKHCLPFIPGAVLRGAVGTAIIKSVCKLDKPLADHESCKYFTECLYARLFGEEFGKKSNVFFRFAYPLHLRCDKPFLPAPKTLACCQNPQCRKEFDALFSPFECDACSHSVKPFDGFKCEGCGLLERHPVTISRVTLTAVDKGKVSAAQVAGAGTLHTLEIIPKDAKFACEVIVDGDFGREVDVVKAALVKALPDEGIGGSKSRGLGKVEVEDLCVEELDGDVVRKRAEEIDVRRFSVRLVSPMVLEGKTLEPTNLLEAARRAYTWVFHEGKPRLPEVRLEGKRVGIEMFSGWSLKTGRRRRIEPAVSAGSVFQFRCDENSRELALALAALEYYAVGACKPHGCGQVVVEAAR